MKILEIKIDQASPQAKHQQLAAAIKKLIKKRVISGREFLPGERTLAKHIGVTRDVVHRAYKLLEAEGLIEFSNHLGHRLVEDPRPNS